MPIVLAQLAKRIISLTDALWLGTLDLRAINAVVTAIAFELVPFFVAFAFSQGVFSDIARAKARGDTDVLAHVSSRALTATFAFGLLVTAFVWLCPAPVQALADLFPSVDREILYRYIEYSSLGYPAAYANVLLIFLLASESKGRAITLNYTACCVINLILDGYACTQFEDIRDNVAGLALASTVCRTVTFFVLWRLVRVRPRLRLRYLAHCHRLFKAGIPFTLMKLSVLASSIVALRVVAPHGEAHFAAFNLTERMFEIVMAVFVGLEGALLYRLSAPERDQLAPVLREYARLALGVTLASCALVLAVPFSVTEFWLGTSDGAALFLHTLLAKALAIPFTAWMILAHAHQRMVDNRMRSSLLVIAASSVKLGLLGLASLYAPSYWAALAIIFVGLPCVEPVMYRLARGARP